MNTFVNALSNASSMSYTENGARTYTSTQSAVYDMFALGGAYRSRSDADVIALFERALAEDSTLAMKCLFWMRDVRGGAGERRFFRVCIKWLAKYHTEAMRRNLKWIAEYGRYDDFYALMDTPLEAEVFEFLKTLLAMDMTCKTPSLLAKWLPSENTSSSATRALGARTRRAFGMTPRQYRKTLSVLRERINVLERLMSSNQWDKIEFDKIPSKAGLIYKNAFAKHDVDARYEKFIKSEDTKVNAGTLYPYEIVRKAIQNCENSRYRDSSNEIDRLAIDKYWDNQIDYLDGKPCKMMCVCDTSGSMTWSSSNASGIRPIDVAISLSMYCAERVGGPFKGKYISFSRQPKFIDIQGKDFVEKVKRIYDTNLCENTNLEATFNLLLEASLMAKPEDRPDTLVIISDMEIDAMATRRWCASDMEQMRKKWERFGVKCPHLVYWNVNARNDNILDTNEGTTYVSGASPTLFKQVISGKKGYDLMIETICSDRYENIK